MLGRRTARHHDGIPGTDIVLREAEIVDIPIPGTSGGMERRAAELTAMAIARPECTRGMRVGLALHIVSIVPDSHVGDGGAAAAIGHVQDGFPARRTDRLDVDPVFPVCPTSSGTLARREPGSRHPVMTLLTE